MTRHRLRDTRRLYAVLGVATILVVIGIGVIAYRANLGLPWQSRYEVNVEVPDADRLINAADVRIAGVRVGEVLRAEAMPGNPPYARLRLALDKQVKPLPVDSTVQVRPASVLGLTYVDINLGQSDRTVPAGGTLPAAQATASTDLTDLYDVFRRSAAVSFRNSVSDIGYGLAAQGGALNEAIGAFSSLAGPLTQAARTLAAPATRLREFIDAYAGAFAALAPVGGQLSHLVKSGATTFNALARARGPLGAAIEAAPGAETATATAFRTARPALSGLARLTVELRPAGRLLPHTLGQINSTLQAGVTPLRELPLFAHYLRIAFVALEDLSQQPTTGGSLRKLVDLVTATNEVLSTFTPGQVNCNIIGIYGGAFSSVFTGLGVDGGPGLPNLVVTTGGAQQEPFQNPRPSANLHINPLPNENANECEAGNEPNTPNQQLNNPPGLQSKKVPKTTPPPGVLELARQAGLLAPIEGRR
jgi:virulence factor Mce-like protein